MDAQRYVLRRCLCLYAHNTLSPSPQPPCVRMCTAAPRTAPTARRGGGRRDGVVLPAADHRPMLAQRRMACCCSIHRQHCCHAAPCNRMDASGRHNHARSRQGGTHPTIAPYTWCVCARVLIACVANPYWVHDDASRPSSRPRKLHHMLSLTCKHRSRMGPAQARRRTCQQWYTARTRT